MTTAPIADRLAALRERLAAAAFLSGRSPDAVTLCAVSKTFPPDAIAAAIYLYVGAPHVARRPSFWCVFGVRLGKALLPLAWRFVSRRMPPEEEAAWRAAE